MADESVGPAWSEQFTEEAIRQLFHSGPIAELNNRVPVLFAVLADGIAGHRAGEVAAELAFNHIMQAVARSDGRHVQRILKDAVVEASNAIAAHSASNENLKGMGATCTCGWIIGDLLYTAYVGDSRMYLLRGGRIQQLTTDHTWVQEAIDKGILTPEWHASILMCMSFVVN